MIVYWMSGNRAQSLPATICDRARVMVMNCTVGARTVRVPMPPSTNNLYTRGRGHGKRVMSSEYRKWLNVAVPLLRTHAKIDSYPVYAEIVIEGKLRATADIDNRIKACLDAAKKAGVIEDDNHAHVTKVTIEYRHHDIGDGVLVSFREIGGQEI